MRIGGPSGGSTGTVIFFVFAVVGLYLINSFFNFVKLPSSVSVINNWVNLIAGALLIFGAFNYLSLNRHKRRAYYGR